MKQQEKNKSIVFPTTFPVTHHTDFVGFGSTFVAIQGMKTNGIEYIPLALERGATTIVIDKEAQLVATLEKELLHKNIAVKRVSNCRRALAELSAQALHFPANKLKIIGITGTKGKTTTSFLVHHILNHAGYKAALLSTVYNKIGDQIFKTHLTTQHPDYVHIFFDLCVKVGVKYVVMEVAAQACNLERVYGINFDSFIFTNFDQEHAEFYPTLDDYFAAKCALLEQTKVGHPLIINTDNSWCTKFTPTKNALISFGKNNALYTFDASSTAMFSILSITYKNKTVICNTSLIGEFNAYNITASFVMCHQLGIDPHQIAQALSDFKEVPGRLERYILPNNAVCFIDYAHNPSSYESVLSTLRTLSNDLIVVCGAGGDRDKTKRPLMGALAAHYADKVFLTSDNPRSEDPALIIQEMIAGIPAELQKKIESVLDREEAIKKAYYKSKAGSIIALLGKGPDHYQIVKDQKIYFNESEILQRL